MGHPFLKRIRHAGRHRLQMGRTPLRSPSVPLPTSALSLDAAPLYDNVPALCMALNSTGRVVALNRFGGQLLGVHHTGAIGSNALDWLDRSDAPAFLQHLERCTRSALHIAPISCTFIHRLGRLIQIRGTIRQAPELGVGIMALVGILVSDRIADPTGLLDHYLQQAVDHSTDWAFIYNVARRQVAFMGEQLLSTLGYSAEDVRGQPWDNFIHPHDISPLDQHLRTCLDRAGNRPSPTNQCTSHARSNRNQSSRNQSREAQYFTSEAGKVACRASSSTLSIPSSTDDIEFRIRTRSGEWRWWNSQGNAFIAPASLLSERRVEGYVLGTVRDITERKRAEVSLNNRIQQERLLRGVAEKISESLDLDRILSTTADEVRRLLHADRVAIFRCGLTKGTVVVASRSPNCPQLLSARTLEEQLDPQSLRQFVRGKVQIATAASIEASGDMETSGGHARVAAPDGGIRDVATTSKPFAESQGHATGTLHHNDVPTRLPVQSHAVIPIEQDDRLWGLISIQHCSAEWKWRPSGIELLQHLAAQVSIAVTQAELYRRTQQQAQREQALNRVTRALRTSLNLKTVFATAVNLITSEFRVASTSIWQFLPENQVWQAICAAGTSDDISELVGKEIDDGGACPPLQEINSRHMLRLSASEARDRGIEPAVTTLLPGQWWVIPLRVNGQRWGCLILSDDRQPSTLSASNQAVTIVAFIEQLEIAIQQAELYQQVQTLNFDLERKIRSRTYQLRQALELEETLKQITDKVRDSLDEGQILQAAVRELAEGLEADCCEAGLYSNDRREFTIAYEHTTHSDSARGRHERSDPNNRIHRALLSEQPVQFCPLDRRDVSHLEQAKSSAILVCPIVDERGVLGHLWLFRPRACTFGDLEVRIVKQVATQCAIGIRQARLYQAAQTQVEKLQQLNQLKDDFLNTVSHELRTPVTSMRMAIQMLGVCLNEQLVTDSDKPIPKQTRISRYYQVLKEECEREIRLVDDLLSLQTIEGAQDEWDLDRIHLPSVLSQLMAPYEQRTRDRQQVFQIPELDHLPDMVVDLAAFDRIVTELLTNAHKYTPAGHSIQLRANATDDTLCITVSNTGIEIPSDAAGKIFDKFYRVPGSDLWKQGGTGLGLALVKRLVERLKGHISMRSDRNQTAFTVTLPLRQPTGQPSLLEYNSL
ncbi:MAG: GAF domain-containing protein [Cyanobacteria bacterium P01_E01_bin.34]